jgi:polar amino acid transport system substrate-binding protein
VRKAAAAALALLAVALAAACGSTKKSSSPSGTTSSSCAKGSLNLVSPGKLTIGTDNPAFPPWYGGAPGHGWKVSDPYSGKGYESAVAYALAKQLGFARGDVTWKYTPFDNSFAPGKKAFDFDINQISFTPARAKVVDFSDSYYDVAQSVVVNDGTPIAKVTTVVQALKNKQIDGLVVDLPTAFYVTAVQVPNSKVLGQFPAQPGGEHFGLVFQKGNSLVPCVNKAIGTLRSNGTLQQLDHQWLAKATGAPILK